MTLVTVSLVDVTPGRVVGNEEGPWYRVLHVGRLGPVFRREPEVEGVDLDLVVQFPDGGTGDRRVPNQTVVDYGLDPPGFPPFTIGTKE